MHSGINMLTKMNTESDDAKHRSARVAFKMLMHQLTNAFNPYVDWYQCAPHSSLKAQKSGIQQLFVPIEAYTSVK